MVLDRQKNAHWSAAKYVNQITPSWGIGSLDHGKIMCKSCSKAWDHPPRPMNTDNASWEAFEQIRDTIWDEVVSHLLTEHKVVQCDHCFCLIKRRNLSAHQKSNDCVRSQREAVMRSRGYERVTKWSYEAFIELLQTLANRMLQHTAWDDGETRLLIERSLADHVRLFEDLGGIVKASTLPVAKATFKDEYWAPRDTAQLLNMFLPSIRKTDDEKILYEVWYWLHADDTQRACQLGIYELQLDYES